MYKFGRKSKERLKGVDHRLISVLDELIKIMDVTIIEGLRSKERQEKLLKQGATKVKYSKHMEGKQRRISLYGWYGKRHCSSIRLESSLGWRLG